MGYRIYSFDKEHMGQVVKDDDVIIRFSKIGGPLLIVLGAILYVLP